MKHFFSEATNISDAFAFTHGATREFNFTFALANKQLPNRYMFEHSNEVACTYDTV